MIECYADRYAVVGGRRYVVGHPCDWSVSLCIPKGKDGVEPIPLESDLMQELLPGLQVRLARNTMGIRRTENLEPGVSGRARFRTWPR